MTQQRVTRRRAIQTFAGAGALLTIVGCSSDSSSDPTTEVATSKADLRLRLWAEPTTALIAAAGPSDVYSFGAEVIEGDPSSVVASDTYLGPTLHFTQGQRVQVTFENRLQEPSIVHWHGLLVAQDQDGQPGDAVGPDETYEYDFVVTNDPGTYWYHPHPHGQTGEQVYRGLTGLLIIHGDEPDLPDGDNDISLVLQDRSIDSDGKLQYISGMHDMMAGFVGNSLVTNGVTDFSMTVRREAYRLRLFNGANSRTQYLRLSTGDNLTAIAADGVLLPEAVDVPGVVITPAQRTDLWIDFSAFEPGDRIELLTADTFVESMGAGGGMGGMGGGDMDDDMADGSAPDLAGEVAAVFVIADSEAVPGVRPGVLGSAPDFGADDAVNSSEPKVFTLSTQRGSHRINDLQWEGREVTETETVGADTIELWEFVSESPIPHPIHLHGKAFRVLSREWDDDSLADAWREIESGVLETGLRDTVLVWPGQRVRIAVPFGDLLGYFPYHCHILEHEDAGMMRNFLVV